ncbi:MAG: hypothetical protein M0T85_15870 [Dehalococcoidales bacterium]|nr:hypothetical protein [Dehalococcoidales bacterium]
MPVTASAALTLIVAVAPACGIGIAVDEALGTTVRLGTGETAAIGFGVGVRVGDAVWFGFGVAVRVGVGVAVAVGLGVSVNVGIGVGTDVGVAGVSVTPTELPEDRASVRPWLAQPAVDRERPERTKAASTLATTQTLDLRCCLTNRTPNPKSRLHSQFC